MRKVILNVLSYNSISLIIGVIGGLFGVISIFLDWKSQISIKYLALISLVFIFIVLILIKIIFDASLKIRTNISGVFSILKLKKGPNGDRIILTHNHPVLHTGSLLSLFYNIDGYELYFGQALVIHIQDKFTQIKILDIDPNFKASHQEILDKSETAEFKENLFLRNIVIKQ